MSMMVVFIPLSSCNALYLLSFYLDSVTITNASTITTTTTDTTVTNVTTDNVNITTSTTDSITTNFSTKIIIFQKLSFDC